MIYRFWIVLDQGRLSEYSNWKQRLDLHIDPIDLRMASVREARNADRRFCFEVITPQFKRVYQATSEDDMNSWISAINNALQSAVESSGISRPVIPPSPDEGPHARRDLGSVLTGKSSSVSHHGTHSHSKMSSPSSSINSVYRRITVGARPSYVRTDSNSFQEHPDKLLQVVRNTDQGNCWCADCGSGVKTEWVSINLGIVLCIECSGIHRSLGTHISKVRSLTLDTTSFTTDIVELLLQVGNRVSNMVWEAKLDRSQKPSSVATREHRLKFITAKYVQREFVAPISSTLSHYSTPDETLLASIKKNDIQGVLYGLALGANPNVKDRSRNTHAVFLALAAADPASFSSPVSTPSRTEHHSSSATGTPGPGGGGGTAAGSNPKPFAFPVAEMLVQNGAEIPTSLPAFPLSRNAQLYLEQRSGRVKGGRPLGDGGATATPTSTTATLGGGGAGGGSNIRPITPSSSAPSGGQVPIPIPRTGSHSFVSASSSFSGAGIGGVNHHFTPLAAAVNSSSNHHDTINPVVSTTAVGGGGTGGTMQNHDLRNLNTLSIHERSFISSASAPEGSRHSSRPGSGDGNDGYVTTTAAGGTAYHHSTPYGTGMGAGVGMGGMNDRSGVDRRGEGRGYEANHDNNANGNAINLNANVEGRRVDGDNGAAGVGGWV